ncbi:hypothetical protein GB931_00770 [Modestobacter sp. I12A-02628]|uniref:Preprotein translocase subunit SecA n=2 Tax=Goekera deserti TaxID=2497753 RepID=A0A7K3WI51_9ACTN|nr:hypothetical protein [Goekera deserti]NDI47210.1 hypothetical protein [Goekera deserti]NEL55390.1 hypothetical protein [Goekera deserti]
MGLPRTPLTGQNSGQPDCAEAMRLAGRIVDCCRTLAVFRGRLSKLPLASLAGEFLGYELSVRGRQYQSVAEELNSGLLKDPTVSKIMADVLGFTVDVMRLTRTASLQLFNQRFFGARDRIGDLVQSGVNPTELEAEAARRDYNLMLNECRLFGAVSSADVSALAGIEQDSARRILEFFATARPETTEPGMVDRYRLGRTTGPGGSIRDGDEYLILNGFMAEDELRRNLERGFLAAAAAGGRAAPAWDKYVRRRAAFSETMTGSTIGRLLGGAQPRWTGQHYLGPVDPADHAEFASGRTPVAGEGRTFESDLLFIVDGVALCVEVKAGSITEKARSGNAQRLAADLQKTLSEANTQANRLATLVKSNNGVWASDGSWLDLSAVQEIHSVVVMLDDMGPLSLAMNELAQQGVIATTDVPWIVSLHDLIVFSRTIDHPAQFLEYVRRRRGRKLATMVVGADELDMLMWFMTGGMFFEPDPDEVSAQVPVLRRVRPSEIRRFEDEGRVHLGTLTDPLDAWIYSTEGTSHRAAPKPTRREEPWVEAYLAASESAQWPGWLRTGADLVSLSRSSQRHIGKSLKTVRRLARTADRERSLTTHGTTPYGSWLLTLAVARAGVPVGHLVDYIEAKQYQTASNRALLLIYRPDGSIATSQYRGEPQPRSPERDIEIATSPLLSLDETFAKAPPRGQRGPASKRRKRPKRRR